MTVVPWSRIRSWRCTACGVCCREYSVVLKLPEWLNIIKNFGVEYTTPGMSKFFLRRRSDGSCAFLYTTPTMAMCSLQREKPQACRLWPFKVLAKPKYSNAHQAVYLYRKRRLFIYADSTCRGLRFGPPNYEFTHSVIPEFVEIALGLRQRQLKTTSFRWPHF